MSRRYVIRRGNGDYLAYFSCMGPGWGPLTEAWVEETPDHPQLLHQMRRCKSSSSWSEPTAAVVEVESEAEPTSVEAQRLEEALRKRGL